MPVKHELQDPVQGRCLINGSDRPWFSGCLPQLHTLVESRSLAPGSSNILMALYTKPSEELDVSVIRPQCRKEKDTSSLVHQPKSQGIVSQYY